MSSTSNATMSSLPHHKPVTVTDWDDFIRQIYGAFDGDEVNVQHVTEIMESYKSNRADWKKFEKYDRYKYTRNLVDEGNGKFNLILVGWTASQASSVHDHTDAHCFMKVLSGSLEEIRYEWPEGGNEQSMVETERRSASTNDVCYINDSLGVHRVGNRSDTDCAVSLHLYCPPFSFCQTFDQRTGKCMKCPVTFHSKFGQKVNYKK